MLIDASEKSFFFRDSSVNNLLPRSVLFDFIDLLVDTNNGLCVGALAGIIGAIGSITVASLHAYHGPSLIVVC